MLSREQRRHLENHRTTVFVSVICSAIVTTWMLVDTGHGLLHNEAAGWGWEVWSAIAVALLAVAGVAAWFAPKVYGDYADAVEREEASALAQARSAKPDGGPDAV